MRRRRGLEPDAPPLSPLPARPGRLPGKWLAVLVLLFCARAGLGAAHLLLTPVAATSAANYINAPDEAAHLGYIRVIAENGRLPVRNDPAVPTYEWHQPPLYYALCAPFYTSGPRALRLLSLLIGLAGLWAIFRTIRQVFPNDGPLAVLAVGFAALLPMLTATNSATGNDVLIELLFTVCLGLLASGMERGLNLRRAGLIGACLAAAVLTKATGLLLLPVAAAAFILMWRSGETAASVSRSGLWALCILVLLVAPWFGRNLRLYGEITPARLFLREFQNTARASDFLSHSVPHYDVWTGSVDEPLALSRTEYVSWLGSWTFGTFVAAYTPPGRSAQVGLPRFMTPQVYWIYAGFGLACLVGMARLHLRRKEFTAVQRNVIALSGLCILLVALSFFAFTWTFFQAQGRYLYPAILPLSLFFALGFRAIVGERYRDAASLLALLVFLALSIAFVATAIAPAYSTLPAVR